MSVVQCEIRPGAYYDSVVLMQLQRALLGLPGVADAGVVMATPANLELLRSSGLLTENGRQADPEDLLLVVKGEDDAAARAALGEVDNLLEQRRSEQQSELHGFRPRSLAGAVRMLPQAQLVLISVPGRYAATVAREALELGKHVFLYSDNVSLQDEIALKRLARDNGLLLMGPDCGTAMIGGVGLGFANRVRPGKVGLIGASGTGLQAISSRLHYLGAGVSQMIGTGGRDLAQEVGGATAQQALRLLGADDETEVIVFVSKPPAPEVATRLLAAARQIEKPVVVYFMGQPAPVRQVENITFALNLYDAAEAAQHASPGSPSVERAAVSGGHYLRGLFAGGTLATETLLSLQTVLFPLYSNVPLRAAQQLADVAASEGHSILDMGADEFTQGRLHPMLDNELRLRRLRREAADPDVAVIVLDVVLGEGAHPDPAAELAPVIAELRAERALPVLVVLLGTDADPQQWEEQRAALETAGAQVYGTVEEMVQAALALMPVSGAEAAGAPVQIDMAQHPLAAINVGLESFYDSLRDQGAEAVHVEWRPPAGGKEDMMSLLAQLKG